MFHWIRIYVFGIKVIWYKRVHREENKLKLISKARLSCCEEHFCVSIICTITIE